jgi:hypothetical protein
MKDPATEALKLRAQADECWAAGERNEADALHREAAKLEDRAKREAAQERRTAVGTSGAADRARSSHSVSLVVLPKGKDIDSLSYDEAANLDLIFEEIPRWAGERRWRVLKDRYGSGAVLLGERALGEYILAAMRDPDPALT